MKSFFYISQHFHPSTTLNGGQIGYPVELVNVTKTEDMYTYNGKELQDELGLDWYDYGWRNCDAGLGRWADMAPLAEKFYPSSTNNYNGNNPRLQNEPVGR